MPLAPTIDVKRINYAMIDRFIVFPEATPNEARFNASELMRDFKSGAINPEVNQWNICSMIGKRTERGTDQRYQNMNEFVRVGYGYAGNNIERFELVNLSDEEVFNPQTVGRYAVARGIVHDKSKGLLLICSELQLKRMEIDTAKAEPAKLGAYILSVQRKVDFAENRVVNTPVWVQLKPSPKLSAKRR